MYSSSFFASGVLEQTVLLCMWGVTHTMYWLGFLKAIVDKVHSSSGITKVSKKENHLVLSLL